MRPGRSGARRAAAGLVLGAAGMIASRLTGRRATPEAQPPPEPQREPSERGPSTDEVTRARAELSEELARRAAGADNPSP